MSRSHKPLRAYKGFEEDDGDEVLSDGSSTHTSNLDPESDSDHSSMSDNATSPTADEDEDVHENLRSVSFGALAEAQDSLARQPRQSHQSTAHDRQNLSKPDAEKINLLRERLSQLKKIKSKPAKSSSKTSTADSASMPSKSIPQQSQDRARASKHAPAEQTSRRAVSRFRPVIEIAQDPFHSRDPRFSSLSTGQQPSSEDRARRNYAFLGEYRDAELSNLKATLAGIKQRKTKRKSKMLTVDEEAEVQELRQNINAIENRTKSHDAKERQKEIVRRHKKEEREKIKQGKKPYFLKRSELKERAEKEKFEGMRAKEREKVMDRRRKKQSQREKRAMPNQRRLPNG